MFKNIFKKKKKRKLIAVLDIGSTKIVCLIASIKNQDSIKIVGIGHSESNGFKAGIITDKKLAENSIITAIDIAERMCKENIDKIILTLSSNGLTSHKISVQLELNGNVITERDVNNLINHALSQIDHKKHEIIDFNTINFSLDEINHVENPIGLFSHKLKAYLQVSTLPSSMIYNLVNCLAECQIDIEDFVSAPQAAAYSCLTKDEKDIGVTLIDLGGTTTSFAIFDKGKIIYTAAIPLGGTAITADIAKGLSMSNKNAERIKTLYGSAIVTFADNYKMIDIPIIGEEQEVFSISNASLNNIISARTEELFEFVRKKAYQDGFDSSHFQRIVLTGGGSLLSGVKEVAINLFKTKIRLAKPSFIEGLEMIDDLSIYSSAIGALLNYAQTTKQNDLKTKDNNNEKSKTLSFQFLKWAKENF